MADAKSKKENETVTDAPKARNLGIRLMPVENSDQPVVANYTALTPGSGMVFIDFGFLDPAMLMALPRVAQQGGKLPESVNGKLAVRVAMGYDALQNLKAQIDRLAAAGRAAAKKGS